MRDLTRLKGITPLLIGAVVLLIVPACGSSKKSTKTSGSQKAKTELNAADQALAKSIVYRPSDFPTGWTHKPHKKASGGTAKCSNLSFSDLTVNGKANSDDFDRGSLKYTESTAAILKTKEQAQTAFERLSSSSFKSCVTDAFKKESTKKTQISRVSINQLSSPSLGDKATAFEIKFYITEKTQTAPGYADIVLIQRDRALAMLMYFTVLFPFDSSTEQQLAQAVAGRM